MSVIQARPNATPCSTGSSTITKLLPTSICELIAPAATEIVDSVSTANFRGTKWLVQVALADLSRVDSYEVYAVHQNGASPTYVQYSMLGDGVAHIVDVVISGGFLQLQITNNEVQDIIVFAEAFPIPISVSSFTVPTTGVSPVDSGSVSVAAAGTGVVGSYATSRYRSVKWLVNVLNPTTNEVQCFEVYSTQRNGTVSWFNVYAITGDVMSIVANVSIVGGSVQLDITNNEANTVIVDATMKPLQVCGLQTGCECTEIAITAAHVVIPPAATLPIDAVTFLANREVKWLIAITDLTTNATELYQLDATHRQGVSVSYVQYGMVGTLISEIPNVVISGLNLTLNITNTGGNTIQVDTIKFPVSV